MTRLAITRKPEQLDNIIQTARMRDVEIIPLPLLDCEYIKFNVDDDVMNRLNWLFFTSANGVRSFFDRLNELNIPLSDRTKIGAVGKKTTVAIHEYGYDVDFTPSESYGKSLFLEFVTNIAAGNENVMFARAEKIVYDPEYLFNLAGLRYYSIICYKTTENEIPAGNINSLTTSDFILFTAPSAVRSYYKL
ncbi:MAG: uroporphyrinogen-III synthase, partial [Candidatus Zixiibacteriota bacterium]